MKNLKALTKALKENGAMSDSTYSAVDQGVLVPTGLNLGHGIEIARIKYAAIIQIENLPDHDAYLLLAFLTAWLVDHDPDRDQLGLSDPEIDVSLNGDGTADVELAIDFDEGLQIVPDESGSIPFAGQMWRVADVPIDVAESLGEVARQGAESHA